MSDIDNIYVHMSLQSVRNNVKTLFQTRCKSKLLKKRIDVVEQTLYQLLGNDVTDIKDKYVEMMSGFVSSVDLYESQNNVQYIVAMESIVNEYKNGKYGWNHKIFDSYVDNEKRTVMNISKPPDVEEGVFVCQKCGGNKTMHYSRQIR